MLRSYMNFYDYTKFTKKNVILNENKCASYYHYDIWRLVHYSIDTTVTHQVLKL